MGSFNSMPNNAIIIDNYEDFKDFFTYCLESESRQPHYDDNLMHGSFSLRIYWINKTAEIGYGIADDWKNKKIIFYKFGSEDSWKIFKHNFGAKFRGDNS